MKKITLCQVQIFLDRHCSSNCFLYSIKMPPKGNQSARHTIILVQYTASYETRSYLEFPTIPAAMDALVKMYEHKLKELNPRVAHITYDIADLYNFLDSLKELVGLVLNSDNSYDPKDKTWIKEKIMEHLRGQAA